MSNESLLAAVRTAAGSTALPASAGNQPEETNMTTPTAAAPATITSLAALQAAYPALCTEMQTAARVEGATAERDRITAIDKLARPGREKIIAEAKADPAMTADKTAVRLLAADDAAKDTALANIKGVEAEGGKVVPAPSATAEKPSEKAAFTGKTEAEWKSEHQGSAALQSEFASEADYVALRKAEAAGRVRVLGARKPAA